MHDAEREEVARQRANEEKPSKWREMREKCVFHVSQCLPEMADLATDHVRLRTIAPVVMLLIYYSIAVIITGR